MTKKYILVAGVNGAGKSTLFLSNPHFFDSTLRLNADEILLEQQGNWQDKVDQAKSMRELIKRMNHYFEVQESFHHETTLAGSAKSFQKRIDQAKSLGYETMLIYVYLSDVEIAIDRVNRRVLKGGHGIPEETIRKRYLSSIESFKQLSTNFDHVIVLDNTEMYQMKHLRNHEKVWVDNLPKALNN